MDMANVIYIIVAILFVLRIVNRNKQNAEEKNKTESKSKTLFESMRPDAVAQNQKATTVRVNQNSRTKQKKTKRSKKSTLDQSNRQTFSSLAAAESPAGQRSGESMTDYLARKAHEEEVERKKEEWEERREEQKSAGNLRIANRLPFGEHPPRGTILKKCLYCGAENLVPQMSREKYHCYFCRSSLK